VKAEFFDYLVVGSGLAGLTFAIRAAQHGRVGVLTKAAITDSNTSWAQGGIAAAVGESDDWQLHEEDTLRAGGGLCDVAAVRKLVREAPAAVEWLKSQGAQFDSFLGREAGHSRNRIVHHADRTGWEIERAVSGAARRNPRIVVYENAFVTRLLVCGGRVCGLTAQIGEAGLRAYSARAVLLATGGAGKIYARTTNPRIATADGIALADAVGAVIRDMEFMQFHPTVLYHPQIGGFLITEALRGAGATLRNHLGRRFMYDYDPRLELAPRDVVARAIEAELRRLSTWCVYLDATHMDPLRLQEDFPTIWSHLRKGGIEMEKDWVPVTPAQHYSCGGVATDLDGRTNVPGLYASGEVASTGVHGANRLASNSLLEAIVFSMAAAEAVKDEPSPDTFDLDLSQPKNVAENEAIRLRHTLQNCMSQNVGVFRDNRGLAEADEVVARLLAEHAALPAAEFSMYASEAYNLLVAARHVVKGARARKKNVGLHFNADLVTPRSEKPAGFPAPDAAKPRPE
jgi:L-aspartate oxidase